MKISSLQTLLQNSCCKNCFKATLSVNVGKHYGYSQELSIICSNCNFEFKTKSCPSVDGTYDINRRIVHAITDIGKGHAALESFSSIMNLPGMDSKTFTKHLKSSHAQVMQSVEKHLNLVRNKVKDVYQKVHRQNTDVVDISVSYDASWQKRGHTSNYAVGCVIDVVTGYVIDYHVLSKFCHDCAIKKNDFGENSAEYYVWHEGHINEC